MTATQNQPIAAHIFRVVLFGNLISLLAMLVFAWFSLEKLESTAIEADRRIELDYFEQHGEKDKPHRIQTSQFISVFQPKHLQNPEVLPIVFQNIPVPFQGEVKSINKKYSVIAQEFPEGTLYMAKDLRLFEDQEEIFVTSILSLALIILLASLALAFYASRKISRPITKFTKTLANLQPKNLTVYIDKNFHDAELNQIANAVNRLIAQIDDNIQRERKFVAMASHELRTPVAIVLGAANVLEKRKALSSEDNKTLQRIIHASKDMSENIQSLLALAKATKDQPLFSVFDIAVLLRELHENYTLENTTYQARLDFQLPDNAVMVEADRVLARIVVRNLVSNALQHTTGKVTVSLQTDSLAVSDEGSKHSSPSQEADDTNQHSGLGLYIVGLACDALAWRSEQATRGNGRCMRLIFNARPEGEIPE